jgi:hypothetical protein
MMVHTPPRPPAPLSAAHASEEGRLIPRAVELVEEALGDLPQSGEIRVQRARRGPMLFLSSFGKGGKTLEPGERHGHCDQAHGGPFLFGGRCI